MPGQMCNQAKCLRIVPCGTTHPYDTLQNTTLNYRSQPRTPLIDHRLFLLANWDELNHSAGGRKHPSRPARSSQCVAEQRLPFSPACYHCAHYQTAANGRPKPSQTHCTAPSTAGSTPLMPLDPDHSPEPCPVRLKNNIYGPSACLGHVQTMKTETPKVKYERACRMTPASANPQTQQ